MEVKKLIRILQALDPESFVTLSLGRDDEYRKKCAKAELITGDCLEYLDIDRVEIYTDAEDSGEIWADIIVKQNNSIYFEEEASKFDKKYQMKDES